MRTFFGASCVTWSTCFTTYKITKTTMLWAKGSAMRKRRMAEDKNERRINTLK
jgi:hypothetical protein